MDDMTADNKKKEGVWFKFGDDIYVFDGSSYYRRNELTQDEFEAAKYDKMSSVDVIYVQGDIKYLRRGDKAYKIKLDANGKETSESEEITLGEFSEVTKVDQVIIDRILLGISQKDQSDFEEIRFPYWPDELDAEETAEEAYDDDYDDCDEEDYVPKSHINPWVFLAFAIIFVLLAFMLGLFFS